MEDLNKQQIVLLTLFTSFVTSIATGIFTVSLMQQTPKSVGQTINQVIERTIERVVPTDTTAAAVIKSTPTYDDITASATQKALKSIVKVVRTMDNNADFVEGYGVVLNVKGEVVTDKTVTAVPGQYAIILSDGTRIGVEVVPAVQGNDVAFLSPLQSDVNRKTANFVPVTFSSNIKLGLGTTLLLVGGGNDSMVYQGIVQKVSYVDDVSAGAQLPSAISFSSGHGADLGSGLFTLAGELVGLKTQSVNSETSNDFLPAYQILKATGLGVVPASATSTVTTQ